MWCVLQVETYGVGLKSRTLQHSLPTQTPRTAHKCIPDLRKIGYQIQFSTCRCAQPKKRASPNTHFTIQRLCRGGGKSLPTLLFFCFVFLGWMIARFFWLGLSWPDKGSQSEVLCPSRRRNTWENVAEPHTALCLLF